ncbi:MAG: A/G-specific adenine glycosylase [Chloroflexi bacterium]|nr:A/G-specific adenine glycosylase [Chloroflexota bacterium]
MRRPAVDPERAERIADALLDWYAGSRRDLPWRQSRDPYAILVAEVMLQQTQVERVVPKWRAWLERFPSLADLARASRADAIRAWQGLGYNLRAVRLHAIACQVVAEYDGVLPASVEGLLALKGIGRYTAGAVACFAYEQPVAMVDTNIRRVLSRLFEIEPLEVEALAERVLPAGAAYAWNQALMDLGSIVCGAQRARCLACPLVTECAGPAAAPSPRHPPGEFRGSRRFYRGRLVDALRATPSGTSLNALCGAVGGAAARERMLELVQKLAADGLVVVDAAQHVRLFE